MDLAVGPHHTKHFLGVENADVVYGIDQRVRPGCAVPAKLSYRAFGLRTIYKRPYPEASFNWGARI